MLVYNYQLLAFSNLSFIFKQITCMAANNFLVYCENGHLEDLKEVCKNIDPEILTYHITTSLNSGLANACKNGHLDIMKYLLDRYKFIKFHDGGEPLFRLACKHGHLHICKYLLQIKPDIDIWFYNMYAFREALNSGHIEVVKWFIELKPEDTMRYINVTTVFINACLEGNLKSAKCIFELNKSVNITRNDHNLFRQLTKSSSFGIPFELQIEVVKWLILLKPEFYYINADKIGIRKYCVRTNADAKWYKIKYAAWLASDKNPNKTNILYKVPQDVSRYIMSMI